MKLGRQVPNQAINKANYYYITGLKGKRQIQLRRCLRSCSQPEQVNGLSETVDHSHASSSNDPLPLQEDTCQTFFSDQYQTFSELGVSAELCKALQEAGFTRPAAIQARSFQTIQSRDDVVIATEAGTGKTLAYLIPVIDRLLQIKEELKTFQQTKWYTTTPRTRALILCPNVQLAYQVIMVANNISDEDGLPLIPARYLSESHPPLGEVYDSPSIMVSTPQDCFTFYNKYGAEFGREWHKKWCGLNLSHVIVDEADWIVDGNSRKRQYGLHNLIISSQKRIMWAKLKYHLGLEVHQAKARVPGPVAQAFLSGQGLDLPDYQDLLYKPYAQETLELARTIRREVPAGSLGDPYCGLQYIYCSGSMPVGQSKRAAATIYERHSDVKWVLGDRLHRLADTLKLTWQDSSRETFHEQMSELIQKEKGLKDGSGLLLVFADDARVQRQCVKVLKQLSVRYVEYYQHMRSDEMRQTEILLREEAGYVVIADDAASRGLDLPNINHVIHATFPTDTVRFLHRCGRTGRAGRPGRVTCLVWPKSQKFAQRLQQITDRDQKINYSVQGVKELKGRSPGRKVVTWQDVASGEASWAEKREVAGYEEEGFDQLVNVVSDDDDEEEVVMGKKYSIQELEQMIEEQELRRLGIPESAHEALSNYEEAMINGRGYKRKAVKRNPDGTRKGRKMYLEPELRRFIDNKGYK